MLFRCQNLTVIIMEAEYNCQLNSLKNVRLNTMCNESFEKIQDFLIIMMNLFYNLSALFRKDTIMQLKSFIKPMHNSV